MSAAFCLREEYKLDKGRPLTLRYGFHLHAGAVEAKAAEARRQAFADSAAWQLSPAKSPWRWSLRRSASQ